MIVGKEGDNCGGESPNVDIWALIEEQGYYESEEDEDEDGLDSDSTHYTDSSKERNTMRTMKAKNHKLSPTAMGSFGSNHN